MKEYPYPYIVEWRNNDGGAGRGEHHESLEAAVSQFNEKIDELKALGFVVTVSDTAYVALGNAVEAGTGELRNRIIEIYKDEPEKNTPERRNVRSLVMIPKTHSLYVYVPDIYMSGAWNLVGDFPSQEAAHDHANKAYSFLTSTIHPSGKTPSNDEYP
jgi:hypothetical protein